MPITQSLAVLISSVGRRSQLVECFRRAFSSLGIEGVVYGADVCPDLSPAAHLVDECFRVPRCGDPSFIKKIAGICRDKRVSLIIPTIDTELAVYANARQYFLDVVQAKVIVSDPRTVQIASDKVRTHRWLVEHGFPTVRQAALSEVMEDFSAWDFPVIVKPHNGSASVGVTNVLSSSMLRAMSEQNPSLIVQERALGEEHTVNVYIDEAGRCVCVVPHIRLETRSGEVSKAITVRNGAVIEMSRKLAESLPGARGPLNFQCFVAPDGAIQVIEINARFGGGYPLADHAGAKFARWIIEERFGLPSTQNDEWREKVLMLRYDEAVFLEK